jgi:hypothetical protein
VVEDFGLGIGEHLGSALQDALLCARKRGAPLLP